ncbi:zinc-binding alcohol dehydrogenase family protein [Deinococcus roseus]|uniref:Zinc-type alcohol dehydrogenase-like protein n=2 Tax=Deinococcus roseus TaxID=392414 RepID=A0ABQ2DAV6_9DEIO|nr:zinc-binding alcohol dehydrogenase family protein [Deinococcus roseus]GGJ51581.1 oxidoreductase [Deinococcus roseus]
MTISETQSQTQNPLWKSTMKVVSVKNKDSFVDLELPTPEPTGQDVLIAVKAVSVNPVDFKVHSRTPGELSEPKILGWDGAGVVVKVGPDVTLFKEGDEVYWAGSIIRPGSNAEFQLVDQRIVALKPRSLNFAEAAALPLTAITAWEGIHDRLRIGEKEKGKTLLVIGGAGGVGSILIQIAKLAGLKVIATASRPETLAWVKEMGADVVIDHSKPLHEELAAIGIPEVDFIYNTVDTVRYWDTTVRVIKAQGSIVSINGTAERLPLGELMGKSVSFHWEMMFTRSSYQTQDILEQHHLLTRVAELIDTGVFKNTFTADLGPINAGNLKKAHTQLQSGRTIGKVVLSGW